MLTGVAAGGPAVAGSFANVRPAWVLIAVAATLGTSEASAAAVGPLAASTGLLATLLAVFALKGWPTFASASTVSAAGSVLVLAVAVGWLVPVRQRASLAAIASRLFTSLRRRTPATSNATSRGGAPAASVDHALEARLVAMFLRVQHAWDEVELQTLAACTTPEMLAELLDERRHCAPHDGRGRTRIITVEPELCSVETRGDSSMLGVVFSGRLQEEGAETALPFREFWLLTRSAEIDSDWRLARHQALY